MINIANINQTNQASKTADKSADAKKIDAVQNVAATKKLGKDKKSSRQDKKRQLAAKDKFTKKSAQPEIDNNMYDKQGKKKAASRLNLKA